MTSRVILVLRLLLGGVFLYAAWTKLRQSYLVFAMSIDSYQLLPEWAVLSVARALPWIELLIGALLLTGWRLRIGSVLAAVVLGGFFGVMAMSYGKGMGIDCGCFGLGDALTWKSLIRDGVLWASSIVLAVLAHLRIRSGEA